MCWRQTNAAQLLNCAARIRRQRQSEKLKGLILMCRICCSPPGNLGNHTGRLAVYKPFTGSPKVLLITTQGRPTHLTCGQTIMRIIIPRPRSWRKGKLHPLSGQNASLRTNNWGLHPTNKREAARVRLVMALFPASLTQAGMYPHGWYSLFKLQGERFFFPVRPIAHEKRRNITQVINIFLFFFVGGKFAYLQRTHPFQKQTLFLCCYIHPFS